MTPFLSSLPACWQIVLDVGDQDLITLARPAEGSDFRARYQKFFYYDHPATMMRGHGTRSTEIDEAFEARFAEIAKFRRIGKKAIDVYHG